MKSTLSRVVAIALSILLLASFGMAGCAKAPEEKPKKTKVKMSILGPGTESYIMNIPQIRVINKYSNLMVIASPVPSPTLKYDHLERRDADIGMGISHATSNWFRGTGEWEGPPHPKGRVLTGGGFMGRLIVVPKWSDIYRVTDLKGKKVATLFLAYGGVLDNADELALRAGGLDSGPFGTIADIIEETYEDPDAAFRGLARGEVAAVVSGTGGARYAELEAAGGYRVLPIDAEEAERLIAEAEGGAHFERQTVFIYPGGRQPRLAEDVVAVGSQHIYYTMEWLDDEIAYTFVKTLLEHQDELIQVLPVFVDWSPENAVRKSSFVMPFHPGAIKYYMEIGVWTDEKEALQQKVLALAAELAAK